MLNEVARARPARLDSAIDVEILSVATAVPEHVVTQTDIGERARRISPQFAHMESLFANTGISRRYAVEPAEWYLEPRSWVERTASYQKHALDLLARVAQDAVRAASLPAPMATASTSQPAKTGTRTSAKVDTSMASVMAVARRPCRRQ